MLIGREKLKDIIPAIAGKMRFRPAIIEKDYYLTVILNNVETLLSDKIVFKGGTLLNKAHLNYHRLSEDLDFTYNAEFTTRSQRSRAVTPIREKTYSRQGKYCHYHGKRQSLRNSRLLYPEKTLQ